MTDGIDRKHTLLYFGPFDLNFRSLAAAESKKTFDSEYVDWDAKTKCPAERAQKNATGLQFRYMRRLRSPEEDFVVGVATEAPNYISIVLRAPVLLVHERHMDGKWFAASNPVYPTDDSALRLLVDMVVANPEYRDELGRLMRGLGERSPK
jgi:hypothetical protein